MFEKQVRVNQATIDKATEIAKNKMKKIIQIRSLADISVDIEDIGAILLIEPTIELALEVGDDIHTLLILLLPKVQK